MTGSTMANPIVYLITNPSLLLTLRYVYCRRCLPASWSSADSAEPDESQDSVANTTLNNDRDHGPHRQQQQRRTLDPVKGGLASPVISSKRVTGNATRGTRTSTDQQDFKRHKAAAAAAAASPSNSTSRVHSPPLTFRSHQPADAELTVPPQSVATVPAVNSTSGFISSPEFARFATNHRASIP